MNHQPKLYLPLKKTHSHQKSEPPKHHSTFPFKSLFSAEFSSKLHLFLFLLYSGTSLNTQIPTSYLSIKSAQKKALFYYRSGELHMESDRNSYDKFFELTKESELRKYRQPKYIHFTSTAVCLYSDEAEARENSADQEFSLLQKYVCSSSRFTKKTRVCWNKEKGFGYWQVANKNPLPKTEWFATELSLRPKNSVYMFNVTDYNYAGRLLKTSLSPFSLHSSKMKSEKLHMKKNQFSEALSSKYSNITRQASMGKYNFCDSLYLTRQSDIGNTVSVNIHIRYAQLEAIIKDFLGMIGRWRDLVNGNHVSEAYFDFIENSKGRWFLIGCKIKSIDLELLLQSLSLRKFMRTGTINANEVKKVEPSTTDEEQLEKKFLSIKQRLKSINVHPASFVSSDKISEYSLYTSFSGSLCLPQSLQSTLKRESCLSPLASLYDKTILKAKELKKQAKIHEEILKEYALRKEVIGDIIEEIIGALGNHEVFGGFIRQSSKSVGFREFFDNCLQGNPPNSRSAAMQLIRDIGVNKRNFQDFLLSVIGVLEKYYEEECKDLLMYRVIENAGFNESA